METPKKFNNTPNERIQFRYTTKNGTQALDYWISRAVAVVGVVFAIKENNMHVLITKRSDKMRDEAGKFGVPCGYLDWDETGFEGMTREVYEETSLYLPDYKNYLVYNNNEKPFIIKDNPKDNRQNISMIYISVYNFNPRPDLFPVNVETYKDKETAMVKWMPLIEFYGKYNEMEWAFHHDDTIKLAVEQFNKIGTTIVL
jgi:8-oxo-dGTP pyrophosphatase MutT (NUDIX family)